MKTTRIVVFLCLVSVASIIPHITHAAWWNPFDWNFNSFDQHKKVQEQTADEAKPQDTNILAGRVSELESENADLKDQIGKLIKATSACKLSASQNAVVKNAVAVITPTPVSSSIETKSDSEKAKALRVELARLDKLDLEIDTLFTKYKASRSEDDRAAPIAALIQVLTITKKNTGEAIFVKNLYDPTSAQKYVWLAGDLQPALQTYMHAQIAEYRAGLKIDLAQFPAGEAPAT